MQIKVNFLDNLRLEALFDDFKVITDQPIRYKGDGSAPGAQRAGEGLAAGTPQVGVPLTGAARIKEPG